MPKDHMHHLPPPELRPRPPVYFDDRECKRQHKGVGVVGRLAKARLDIVLRLKEDLTGLEHHGKNVFLDCYRKGNTVKNTGGKSGLS